MTAGVFSGTRGASPFCLCDTAKNFLLWVRIARTMAAHSLKVSWSEPLFDVRGITRVLTFALEQRFVRLRSTTFRVGTSRVEMEKFSSERNANRSDQLLHMEANPSDILNQ